MWNRYLIMLLLLPLLACSGKERQRVFVFRNHNSSPRHVLCEIDDPSDFLRVRRNKSLLITDANGFTVPYQKTDSGTVVFMVNIPPAESKKYTIEATKQHPDFPSPLYCRTLDNGDVVWGNGLCSFFMHSAKVPGDGAGFGFAPDGPGKGGYLFRHSLGCGGLAPLSKNHLLRYGNFTKMELIDSGPVLLRMRFSFPEFQFNGRKVHEERTVSIFPNVRYSKVESRFVGTDSMFVAICLPYKGENGLPVPTLLEANKRFAPIVQLGRGYMCYAENGTSDMHGTIFTAVIFPERLQYRNMDVDGHQAVVSKLDSDGCFVYYIAGASSLTGMNYQMWTSLVESSAGQLRADLQPTSYDVE